MNTEAQAQINDIFRNCSIPSEDELEASFLKKNMDEYISFGVNCTSASCFKESGVREKKLPFDWMQASIPSYLQMLSDMINNTLDLEICINPPPKPGREGDITEIVKYDAWIPHEPEPIDANIIKLNYIKYFKRLYDILSSKNKNIFIMISSHYNSFNDENLVDVYETFLKKEFPDNNYYFFTTNTGRDVKITSNRINVINQRMAGTYVNGKWIGGIWQEPIVQLFKKYLKK